MADPVLHIDPVVLQQIADGDEQAFAVLYSHFAPRLQPYAWKFTRSESDAHEILQETFLSIWMHRDQLPALEYLQAWIYKIVARHCLQWMRKQQSEGRRMQHAQERSDGFIPTPSDIFQWQELQRFIQAAIAQLPELRQQIYRINREEGLKPAVIASQLNLPVGTVKNHLSAALKFIREHLIQSGYPFLFIIIFFVGY